MRSWRRALMKLSDDWSIEQASAATLLVSTDTGSRRLVSSCLYR
jgi:hypothetical protein